MACSKSAIYCARAFSGPAPASGRKEQSTRRTNAGGYSLSFDHRRRRRRGAPVGLAPGDLVSQPTVIALVLTFGICSRYFVSGALTQGRWYDALDPLLRLCADRGAHRLRHDPARALALTIPRSRPRPIRRPRPRSPCSSRCAVLVASVLLRPTPVAARGWAIEWFVLAWSAIAIARVAVAQILRPDASGPHGVRTVIVGGGKPTFDLVERLDASGSKAIRILGIFDDRDKYRSPSKSAVTLSPRPLRGPEKFCREQKVDLHHRAADRGRGTDPAHPVNALGIADRRAYRCARLEAETEVAGLQLSATPFLPVFDKPMNDWSVALKAIEDRTLAALGLVVLSPLLALDGTAAARGLTRTGLSASSATASTTRRSAFTNSAPCT